MWPFRRKTIFHREDSIPDPEEIKWRFRRKVLLTSALFFVGLISVPVFRELKPLLDRKETTRTFGELLLKVRLESLASKQPITLRLEKSRWHKDLHGQNQTCDSPVVATNDLGDFSSRWQFHLLIENQPPQATTTLCFDPLVGLWAHNRLLTDSESLEIYALPSEEESLESKPLAVIQLSQGGNRIEYLNL